MILNKSQLDSKISFVKEYIKADNAASGSKYDANANVSSKNIATLSAEIHKDINIQIKRAIVTQKISEMFGGELGMEYNRQINDKEIYVHDESNILLPYCVSISMYPLLTDGLRTLGGESGPPSHLSSFCGSFVNLMFAISSQFAGAVAAVELLVYFNQFAIKDYGVNYLETNKKEIENHLQHIVYALNQPAAARSFQSVFWNTSIFDRHYFESMFEGFAFPDGSRPDYDSVNKLQQFFMKWFGKEREKAVLTFPVVTAAILSDGDRPKDESFSEFLAEELANGNSFFIYSSDTADSLSSCCRLKSKLLKTNTFQTSLGAGGVATGSINVITINMNRLTQKKLDLSEQVNKIHKYQIAYREIIKELIRDNILPVYSSGFITLEKQYSTIGINGLVEAAEFLGMTPNNNDKYKNWASSQMKVISDLNKEAGKIYNCMFNTEFVPAENLGVKFAKWDKEDGLVVKRDCYNSYFYPVEDNAINVFDKFELHGKEVTQYLDGGSALHLNLEQYLTKDQYLKLIGLAIKTGCNYFCTNVKITICECCGHVNKDTKHHCVKCGSEDVSYATRIIGYLKKISSWSGARKIEEGKRFYH
jgi:anaerobic ribonucleoside-triphosphate reductase